MVLRENIGTVREIGPWAEVLAPDAHFAHAPEDAEFLALARELLPAEPWDATTWSTWTNALKEKSGRKRRALFHPLRLALTGREDGPELRSLLPILGRRVSLARLS